MLKVMVPADKEKLDKQIAALEYQLKYDTKDKDREIHRAALERLKAARAKSLMEGVKGFNKLSPEQQTLFIKTYQRHQGSVGSGHKEGWTPKSVKPLGRSLKVIFKNGEWLHYTPAGEWD